MNDPSGGAARDSVRVWLRLEGLLVFAVTALLYFRADSSWALFAALFLTPDLSFAGYLAGPRAGAWAYNVVHSYALPILLAVILMAAGMSVAVPLIWIAHIGFDRCLGYGLKYPTAFSHTHLGTIGRASRSTSN